MSYSREMLISSAEESVLQHVFNADPRAEYEVQQNISMALGEDNYHVFTAILDGRTVKVEIPLEQRWHLSHENPGAYIEASDRAWHYSLHLAELNDAMRTSPPPYHIPNMIDSATKGWRPSFPYVMTSQVPGMPLAPDHIRNLSTEEQSRIGAKIARGIDWINNSISRQQHERIVAEAPRGLISLGQELLANDKSRYWSNNRLDTLFELGYECLTDAMLDIAAEYTSSHQAGTLEPTLIGHANLQGNVLFIHGENGWDVSSVTGFHRMQPSSAECELAFLYEYGEQALASGVDTYEEITHTKIDRAQMNFWIRVHLTNAYAKSVLEDSPISPMLHGALQCYIPGYDWGKLGRIDVRPEDIFDDRDEESRIDQMRSAAQFMIDTTENVSEATVAKFYTLHKDLHYRYREMDKHNPAKAEFLVMRALRSVGVAALSHIIDAEFFPQASALLRSDSIAMTDNFSALNHNTLPFTAKMSSENSNIPGGDERKQAFETFLSAGAAPWIEAINEVTGAIQADINHAHSPLFDCMKLIQAECHRRCRQWNDSVEAANGSRPTFQPSERLMDSLTGIMYDNLGVIAQLLIISGLSHNFRINPNASAEELASVALADVGHLGWPASIRRDAFLRMLPPGVSSDLYINSPTQEDLLAAYHTKPKVKMLGQNNNYWACFALQEAPWRDSAAGMCAGRLLLRNSPQVTQRAKEYFNAAGVDPEHALMPDGAYDQVAVLLPYAIHVAKHTLYAAWPKPSRQSSN